MKVVVCIGTSCHIKGSHDVVLTLQRLIGENDLGSKVVLSGGLCTGNCAKGVCVKVDGVLHSVSPETAETFFNNEIKARV